MWVQLIILITRFFFISRINEAYVVFNKISLERYFIEKKNFIYNRLFCCNHNCYCVNMVSVTSVPRYITSASRLHPCYQRGSSMHPCSDSMEFRRIDRDISDCLYRVKMRFFMSSVHLRGLPVSVPEY